MHITHCTVHCKTNPSPSLAHPSPAMNVPNPTHSSLLKWASLQEQLSCCSVCSNCHNLVTSITCPKYLHAWLWLVLKVIVKLPLVLFSNHPADMSPPHLSNTGLTFPFCYHDVTPQISDFLWIQQWSQDVVLKLPLPFVCECLDT